MKHKILINGRNSLRVSDFIQHTEEFFDTLSTSACWQDVMGHFRFFNPEVYVCFVEPEYEGTIDHINDLKNSDGYNGAVIVLMGDSSTCDKIEQKHSTVADLIIRRPVTPDNAALKITRYLDEMSEERQLERDTRQAQMAGAGAQPQGQPAAAEAPSPALAEEPVIDESEEKKHILIVDDDRTVLKMLKSALGDTYEVTTMINGVMVNKLLETKKVDLIFLDYEMPIETGADIFRRIKKDPKSAHIPVCFLTGISEREKIMEVMALKPHAYLLKPVDMDMLASTVVNLLG